MPDRRTARRVGLIGVVAGGLALVGTSVQGIAAIDERLEAATPAAEPERSLPVNDRPGCPDRHRERDSRDELSL